MSTGQSAPRIAVVLNPRALSGTNGELWRQFRQALQTRAELVGQLGTAGDGGNVERIRQLVNALPAQILIAAGGDGTVSEVVQAMMVSNRTPRPMLAIAPLGTANDIARSFGLLSFRQKGITAVERALTAILTGHNHAIDVGLASVAGTERHFVGNFALGMDAEILATRNRVRRRVRLERGLGGYPLYLWSCAFNLLRYRSIELRLSETDVRSLVPIRAYNLLVTNTPQYAGEFRFDADNTVDDGQLDLHVFAGVLDYLRRYPAAWRRHIHYARGEPVTPPLELRRIRDLVIELDSPVATQLDGEEWIAALSYQVRVIPRALTIRTPRPTTHHSPARVTPV